MVPCCSFDLHFSVNDPCGSSFHVLYIYIYSYIYINKTGVRLIYLLRLASWWSVCFKHFFDYLPTNISQGQICFTAPQALEIWVIRSNGLKVVVPGNVHKVAALLNAPLGFLGQPGLCLVAKLSPTLCDPMDSSPPGSSVHGDSPGKNTGVSCHALLQGIFPTQGWNPGLRCYGRILYQMNHQGSPRESVFLGCGLEWNVSEETAQS